MSDDLLRRLDDAYLHVESGETIPLIEEAAARIRELQAQIAAKHPVIQNCTFDLRGTDYACVVSVGVPASGKRIKALVEDGAVFLDGLHILGPTRIAEMKAEAEAMVRAEREACALIASEASAEAVDDSGCGWHTASYLKAVAKAILARDGEAGK